MTLAAIAALAIFGLTYAIIASGWLHRTVAALLGAVAMIVIGSSLGFYNQAQVFAAIDWGTIFLLMGMMVIVGLLSETGFFRFLALGIAKLSRGRLWPLMLLLASVTALASAFLDNVTTVLLMAPVVINVSRTLKIDPTPFLMVEIFSSNLGGTATLIGDPPNIMIASRIGLSFNDFLLHLTPIVLVVFLISMLLLRFLYRKDLAQTLDGVAEVLALDERAALEDRPLLRKALIALGITLLLFIIHGSLGLEPWIVAILGATLLLIMSLADPERALKHVDWSTLVFFGGLFIIVGGLEQAGIMEWIAEGMIVLTRGHLLQTLMIILWGSGLAAALIGSVPFTAAMIPLIIAISKTPIFATQLASFPINPLWWALALGACLGANGTLIAHPANMVVAGISEGTGHPITFLRFLRVGLPFTFASLVAASLMLYLWVFLLRV
ncbi:MAG: ArsB/NhaD family transporter [Candidatus Bipolaricaulia bacterium]